MVVIYLAKTSHTAQMWKVFKYFKHQGRAIACNSFPVIDTNKKALNLSAAIPQETGFAVSALQTFALRKGKELKL